MMDSLSFRDQQYRAAMQKGSNELLERIRAEREGRVAHTAQMVMRLK